MIASVYELLARIGFNHPLHPIVVHWPMGMVIGLFFFGLIAYFWKRQTVATTAHHCAILGFIGVFPTVLFGYMDWQYRYGGQWIINGGPYIAIKMVLAAVLAVLLGISIYVGSKETEMSTLRLVLYLLCLATAAGLGYCGGQIAYG